MASSRRQLGKVPRLTGRAWEDAARELEQLLKGLWAGWSDGIPPGFNDVTPEPVQAGVASDGGTETQGWAAGDHVHAASTDVAESLLPNSTNTEGTSTALARSDHTHDVSAIVDEAMIFAIIFGGK